MPAAVLLPLCLLVARPAPLPEVALIAKDAAAAEPAVRAALGAHAHVLDAARTDTLAHDAAGFGLACDLAEAPCAASFGQLAAVDDVVLLRATALGGGSFVIVTRVQIKGARTVSSLGGRAEDAAALVEQLYGGARAATVVPVHVALEPANAAVTLDAAPVALVDGVAWASPGPHAFAASLAGASSSASVEVPADGRVVSVSLALAAPGALTPGTPGAAVPVRQAVAPIEAGTSLPLVPVAVIATGVVAGLGGGIAWITCDQVLAAPLSKDDRHNYEAVGVGGAVLVGAGALVAGTGALLWAVP